MILNFNIVHRKSSIDNALLLFFFFQYKYRNSIHRKRRGVLRYKHRILSYFDSSYQNLRTFERKLVKLLDYKMISV